MSQRETRSTCPYCGVGCGVLIATEGEQIVGVRGDPDHPANFGRLCTKGSTLHFTASASVTQQTRLLHPMQRLQRGAAPQPIPWNQALDTAASRLAAIHQAHGPDAIGVYVSGQLLTEDYYVFNKLVKGLLGSNHIDTNSRLCMSSAVAGYKATLGADAPPCAYEDLEHAQTVFITGSNMAWAHPILFRRLEDAKRAKPSQKWIVADPRRTETAAQADLHLQLLPGSDVALCHGLLHLMLWEGWVDTAYIAAHTTGFEALRQRVREFTPAHTARLTGLKEADLITAARWFAGLEADGSASPGIQRQPTLSLYCQGLNQSSSGTAKNAALINLHLATGQIGQPGAGPFSLTGQPNAMGGREVGGLANLLSAHRDLANPAHRAEVAAFWGVPDVPSQPGKTAVEMFQAAADGEIKALWIACTNPAQSLPDQTTVRRALERAEFVIVQEAFATTATCAYADLLLPATPWGEKDGTVTNSERRISRTRAAVPPAGQARHDWQIAADIAQRLARQIAPEREALFSYSSAEAVWMEHRNSTQGRDLDITGLSYPMLEAAGPQQWPLPEGATRGQTRLYEDGRFPTPDGKAKFADVPFTPLAEPRDARYPISLSTGRLRDQWHGMSRTGTLGRLYGHEGLPAVDLSATDMQRLKLADGDLVRVRSRRGAIVLPARTAASVTPTQAFIPMHWGEEVLTGADDAGQPLTGVNALTTPAFCPQSKQPELKHCAVAIEKVSLPWRLTAMTWLPSEQALAVREQIKPWLRHFAWASLLPFGREEAPASADPSRAARVGLVLRAGAAQAPSAALLDTLRQLLGLAQEGTLRYDDPRRQQQRALRIRRDADERASATAASGPLSAAAEPTMGRTGVESPPFAPGAQAGRTPMIERLDAFWLAGDASGEAWLRALLEADDALPGPGRLLLAPGALAQKLAGQPITPASPQVCTCFNISEAAITAQLRATPGSLDERMANLQATLKCGSNCGSCLPSLRRLAKAVQPAAPTTPLLDQAKPPAAASV